MAAGRSFRKQDASTGVCLVAPFSCMLTLLLLGDAGEAARCYRSFSATAYPNCQLLSPSYALHWAITNSTISYAVEVDGSVGWLGLGISDGGGMSGADITVVQTLDGGLTWTAGDYFSEQEGRPSLDTSLPGGSKDVTLLHSVVRTTNYTAAAFSRPLEDCDPWDWPVVEDVDQVLIWAYGPGPLSYHGTANRGSASVRLNPLPGAPPQPADPADLRALMLTLPTPFTIPTKTTTYMCVNVELPSDAKYHAIRYRAVSNNSLVHHQVLYSCTQAPLHPVGQLFECINQMELNCGAFYLVGAPNAATAVMPPDAALPFGLGSVRYATLQIHYNNPSGLAGQVDQSGFQVFLTRQLRPNDMGVLTLGNRQLSLPPGQASVQALPNQCPGACTSKLTAPLNIFSSGFHMHHLGQSMSTRLVRNGTELPAIGFRNYYNYGAQSGTGAPLSSRVLLPGDALITTCTYDTLGQTNTTVYGPASSNEMCYNFLTYWPAVSTLDICGTVHAGTMAVATCTTIDALTDPSKSLVQLFQSGQLVTSELGGGTYTPYKSSCGLSATRTRAPSPPGMPPPHAPPPRPPVRSPPPRPHPTSVRKPPPSPRRGGPRG